MSGFGLRFDSGSVQWYNEDSIKKLKIMTETAGSVERLPLSDEPTIEEVRHISYNILVMTY